MAETTKTRKAPAKPRKTAAKTAPVAAEPTPIAPASAPVPAVTVAVAEAKANGSAAAAAKTVSFSREEVARLAHQFWAERGHRHGSAEEDWFRAEQALRNKAS
jgi:hypothetical protein